MQDVCLVFSLIIVFLSFFSTYVFQVSTNTRNSPPASQYYTVMNVCRLGWWGCWWPGTSCPSWCRWPTSASPSATTWPRSTRAGTSPSPTGGQISSSRSSSSTDQVESSTLQFFGQLTHISTYFYACLVSKWLYPNIFAICKLFSPTSFDDNCFSVRPLLLLLQESGP